MSTLSYVFCPNFHGPERDFVEGRLSKADSLINERLDIVPEVDSDSIASGRLWARHVLHQTASMRSCQEKKLRYPSSSRDRPKRP